VLLNQINAGAYQRSVTLPKQSNFSKALKAELANQASEALKSTYSLDFLGIAQVINERDLETRLIDRIRDFILELGYGFCFVGRQHRLTLGRKEYYIDLLFYHRFLRSLVAIDVKVNEFQPEHVGKMDFYLNLLNRKERAVGDNPSIGIILCAENDALEVEYSLSTRANPIGVASYRLLNELPERLQGKLPTARQLKRALSDALQDMPDGRSIASEPIATYGLKRPASIF
jgi:predicted nuclease of restriction endonuclease-like (RecB) superfamily